MSAPPPTRLILIMGVSGSGKSTLGAALAKALACPFIEADDYHSPEAREKMRTGHPLTDADRWPWLARVAAAIASELEHNDQAVVACSALKKAYRTRLATLARHKSAIIHLSADQGEIAKRISNRPRHFMPASLVQSQFAALEPPGESENALTIDATTPLDQAVENIIAALNRS